MRDQEQPPVENFLKRMPLGKLGATFYLYHTPAAGRLIAERPAARPWTDRGLGGQVFWFDSPVDTLLPRA